MAGRELQVAGVKVPKNEVGCVRGDHLQGVSGEIICRVCQRISSAGRARGDHLQGVSGEIIYRALIVSAISDAARLFVRSFFLFNVLRC